MEHPALNAFLGRLQNVDGDDIREMARHVADLVTSPGWRIVADLLSEEVDNVRLQMEWGGVRESPEYTMALGRIRGLQQFQGAADAVLLTNERVQDAARQAAQREEYADV